MKRIIAFCIAIVIVGCTSIEKKKEKLQIVTTTTMITDLVTIIGGDKVEVQGLMGAGVDPHLYKASEGDVGKLYNADVIFYNGLHLEGKLEEIFEKMHGQNKKAIAVTDQISKETLIASEEFASNYDPHVWFDIHNWITIAEFVTEELSKLDTKNAETYKSNGLKYIAELKKLQQEVMIAINELPIEKRILVTAHDAFSYFGKAYQFEVIGLQGLSTATEAGVQDVQKLASFIIEKDVKAIFVETSVPKRTIEALQASVASKGHEVTIGGSLFSDALGDKETIEGTYIGMYKHNVQSIVNALK